jgi:hypothetical protein
MESIMKYFFIGKQKKFYSLNITKMVGNLLLVLLLGSMLVDPTMHGSYQCVLIV